MSESDIYSSDDSLQNFGACGAKPKPISKSSDNDDDSISVLKKQVEDCNTKRKMVLKKKDSRATQHLEMSPVSSFEPRNETASTTTQHVPQSEDLDIYYRYVSTFYKLTFISSIQL